MQNFQVLRGTIYGLTAATIWGSMYVVSDVVLVVIPPFTLLTLRIVLGLVVLVLFAWVGGNLSMPPRQMILPLLLVGIVGIGISLGAQFIGTDLSTAINGALVTSASPAFIALFAVIMLREKITLPRLIAIILATIGVLVILDPTQADFSSDTFIGDMFLAAAAVSWGIYSVLVRRVSTVSQTPMSTIMITIMAFVGGLLIAVPGTLLELLNRPMGVIDQNIILGVLYLGIVSTAVALWLWNRAFALVPATVGSLFFFGQPVSGAILAGIFLDQEMTTSLWIGGGLIAIGVFLAVFRVPANP